MSGSSVMKSRSESASGSSAADFGSRLSSGKITFLLAGNSGESCAGVVGADAEDAGFTTCEELLGWGDAGAGVAC